MLAFSPVASSRAALRSSSGLGALAAGIAAGIGLDRAATPALPTSQGPLVGANGRWCPIATLAALPDDTIRLFTAGAVQGFLVRRDGRLRALSRICIHMGCPLPMNRAEGFFACPYHGAKDDSTYSTAGRQSPSGPGHPESGNRMSILNTT